jgi:cytochrome c553
MRHEHRLSGVIAAASLAAFMIIPVAASEAPPEWAYVDTAKPEMNALPPDDGKIRSVPDSSVQLSIPQIRNFYAPPDWHPDEHPAMPPLVAHGVNPGIYACGYCHLPTGNGRPENANIAGLPADYIVNQVKDMASGARSSSLPKHFPQELMLKLAGPAAQHPGLAEAAAYFASLKPKNYFKVVETETIPKVEVFRWIYRPSATGGTEPIGARVVELPDNFEEFENRDGRTRYTAYVPPGSIAKGEALAKAGKCADCHGPQLKGLKDAPPIAGRSPGYLARQLYDFKTGARNGAGAVLMKPVVTQLTNDDLVAITAYLASLEP